MFSGGSGDALRELLTRVREFGLVETGLTRLNTWAQLLGRGGAMKAPGVLTDLRTVVSAGDRHAMVGLPPERHYTAAFESPLVALRLSGFALAANPTLRATSDPPLEGIEACVEFLTGGQMGYIVGTEQQRAALIANEATVPLVATGSDQTGAALQSGQVQGALPQSFPVDLVEGDFPNPGPTGSPAQWNGNTFAPPQPLHVFIPAGRVLYVANQTVAQAARWQITMRWVYAMGQVD